MFQHLKKTTLLYVSALFFGASFSLYAQQTPDQNSIHDTINQDDLGEVDDQFQEVLFEAMAQRAIENYEKALDLLAETEAESLAVYFEKGKNHLALKSYDEAEKAFRKALKEKPNDVSVLGALFEVYKETDQAEKAIEVAEKLQQKEGSYKEELAELYSNIKEFAKALQQLDEVDIKKGTTEEREELRNEIYRKAPEKEIMQYLEDKINQQKNNPKYYADLIRLYQQSGQEKKALQTADRLKKINAQAPEVHWVYYKKFLEEEKHNKAIKSMTVLLSSENVAEEDKKKIREDFEKLVRKEKQYEEDLLESMGENAKEGNQSNKELAAYYKEKEPQKALSYYEKALTENPNDFTIIQETLTLQIDENEYQDALDLAEEKLTLFPAQGFLYLYKGTAENKLGKYENAEESLKEGIDYVIDNPEMQQKFYSELSKTYQGSGNEKKAQEYQQKADALKE